MLKIICELQKEKNPYDQLVILKYFNCQPCAFSNYQMFDNTYDFVSAANRLAISDHIISYFHKAALNIAQEEYKELAKQLFYVEDLTNYRYIALFDESSKIENIDNFFGVPWIYSTIIRLIEPDPTALFLSNIKNQLFSWLNINHDTHEYQTENFKTIWEKQFLFSIPESFTNPRLVGTLQKSNFKSDSQKEYYAIDNFFLKFLFSNLENSKCASFNQELHYPHNLDSMQIYEQYQEKIPKLVAHQFLVELHKFSYCIKYTDSSTTELNIFVDQTEKFILNSLNNYATYNILVFNKICSSINSELMTLDLRVKNVLQDCKNNLDKANQLYSAGNDLYKMDCSNIEETLDFLGKNINFELEVYNI